MNLGSGFTEMLVLLGRIDQPDFTGDSDLQGTHFRQLESHRAILICQRKRKSDLPTP